MIAVTTARLSVSKWLHFPEGAVKHFSVDTSIAQYVNFCPQNYQVQ